MARALQAYDSLPDGSYHFSVVATNAAGNTDSNGVGYSWVVNLPAYGHITEDPAGDAALGITPASGAITFITVNATGAAEILPLSPPPSPASNATSLGNSTTAMTPIGPMAMALPTEARTGPRLLPFAVHVSAVQ